MSVASSVFDRDVVTTSRAKRVLTHPIVKALGIVLLGAIGWGAAQFTTSEAKDLYFLHQARIQNEANQAAMREAQVRGGK